MYKTQTEMEVIRIKAYPKNKSEIKSIADFLNKEGIEFEIDANEEVLNLTPDQSYRNRSQSSQKW